MSKNNRVEWHRSKAYNFLPDFSASITQYRIAIKNMGEYVPGDNQ
jgi:hypothetical protein